MICVVFFGMDKWKSQRPRPQITPERALDNEGRIFVKTSSMEGSTIVTVFTTGLYSYTELFYWSGEIDWYVFAGTGERPRPAQGAERVDEDWDWENHWWQVFNTAPLEGMDSENAMRAFLREREEATCRPLFRGKVA